MYVRHCLLKLYGLSASISGPAVGNLSDDLQAAIRPIGNGNATAKWNRPLADRQANNLAMRADVSSGQR